jgi:hypothetical protein
MEMWGYSADVRFVKDATSPSIPRCWASGWPLGLTACGLNAATAFLDERIWPLVKLLADAVNDPDPAAQLYGDGLTVAIAARLFAHPPEPGADSGGLAPWQLRKVIDYLDAQLPKRIELVELAALAGLSQSLFSRAFKASTGMAPYRWQHRRAHPARAGAADRHERVTRPGGRATVLPMRYISGGRSGNSPK